MEDTTLPAGGTGGSFDTLRFSPDCNTLTNVNLLVDIEKAFLMHYVRETTVPWIEFDNILIKIK